MDGCGGICDGDEVGGRCEDDKEKDGGKVENDGELRDSGNPSGGWVDEADVRD